jgi:hypothetical protein
MANLRMEHTADGGREVIYRVQVHADEFYWLSADEVAEYVVSQFKDYLTKALEEYDAELRAEDE